jgi:anti-sigma regulatory factor (Ser/Thr protein kinase)
MPEVETRFAATPSAPRDARAFLRDALQTWRLDGVGEITEILAGELVANVVRHVGAPGTLRASSEGGTLRVEVDDMNTDVPVLRRPRANDVSGYGMVLVDELAKRWGVERHPGGKTVWFELDLAPVADERPA